MLFSFLSSMRFSALTAASADPPAPVPVVPPGDAPDDWAVPRLLVPGGGAGELATPPVDPLEPVACANDIAGIAARLRITIKVFVEMVASELAIGNAPLAGNDPDQDPFRNKCRHISLSQGGRHDHAQTDRVRRRHVRQAEAIGARQDGDVSGVRGRGL